MNVRRLVVAALVLTGLPIGLVNCSSDPGPADGRTINVPADEPTIAAGVAAARSGDTVLIAVGIYRESVPVKVGGITIRGVDRNAVVLDGGDQLANGFAVAADGVAIENLTVHNFTQNGVLFNGIEAASKGKGPDPAVVYGTGDHVLQGYRASYVTAYDNGLYGIYAFASRDGIIEHSYVSGHPDSGIYVGQCNPCNAVIRDVIAERNAIGYYGTNASGDVYVVQSVFRHNRLGIAPNSQKAERLAPQARTVVAGNLVVDNDDPGAPRIPNGYFGAGIAVGGGTENLVVRNRVEGNDGVGIILTALNDYLPLGNRIEGNELGDNGTDLVYSPMGTTDTGANCFSGNRFRSSVPDSIESVFTCGTPAGPIVVAAFSTPPAPPDVDYRTIPAPPAQPSAPPLVPGTAAGAGAVPVVDVAAITVPPR